VGEAIGVVVPVHDEQERLDRCLGALARAAAHPDLAGVPLHVFTVLDRCRDHSADIAVRWEVAFALRSAVEGGSGGAAVASRLHVVELNAGNVGAARAMGCAAVLEEVADLEASALWLATTDADSVVPPHWLAHQLALHRAGIRAWAGTVRVEDWAQQPGAVADWFDGDYRAGPGHDHVHGANFGVQGSAYLSGGGFSALRSSEDVALRDALVRAGIPVLAGCGAPVVTSARREARAPDGFAEALRTQKP